MSKADSCPLSGDDHCPMDDIGDKVVALHGSVSLLQRDMKAMATVQEEHHKTLFGNGHEGLKTTMTKVGMKTSAIIWLFGIFITLLAGNLVILLLTH